LLAHIELVLTDADIFLEVVREGIRNIAFVELFLNVSVAAWSTNGAVLAYAGKSSQVPTTA